MDNEIPGNRIGAQAQQVVESLKSSGGLTRPASATDAETAVERATLLAGCYRKNDAADPETYVTALAAVLAEYSPDIVQRVTDPRSGLPSRLQWLPTIKEVRDECEAIDGDRRRTAAMFAREEKQLLERRKFEETKKAKPSYQDLKAQYGENWGLQIATAESEEVKAKRTETMRKANRSAFDAECESAGRSLDSTISPSLRALLKAGIG